MARKSRNSPKKQSSPARRRVRPQRVRWSKDDDKMLKTLIRQNTPTRVMGLKLKRTEGAVRQRAKNLHLSLRPTNRPAYG